VQHPLLKEAYEQYSFNVIPWVGGVVASDRASYQYLVESIALFHSQEDFKQLIVQAGFHHVEYTNLSNGIVAIHSGFKL
jgi:ubiquinone/menaquinone biosynthesis C-methylase UbiE